MTVPVLVTGGDGVLGRPIVAALRAAGREVASASRASREHPLDIRREAEVRALVERLRP
ncbi:sugar nucleotide-binding protein, partial [Schumannella luteola]